MLMDKTLNLTADGKILGNKFARLEPILTPLTFRCRFVRAGFVRYADGTQSDIFIPPETLREAVSMNAFNDKAVFLDHSRVFESPSMRNLVGKTGSSEWDEKEQAVNGTIQLYDTQDGKAIASLLGQILEDPSPPDVGLSLVFYPLVEAEQGKKKINAIRQVESVDIVFQPAADGRILKALSALVPSVIGLSSVVELAALPIKNKEKVKMDEQELQIPLSISKEAIPTKERMEALLNEPITKQEPVAYTAAEERLLKMEKALATYSMTINPALILASDLPNAAKDKLIKQAGNYSTPQDMQSAIEAEKVYLASLVEDNVIQIGGLAPRGHKIQGGMDGFDQIKVAFDAMLDGIRPAQGIRPLSGIREFYNLISGDYEMSGIFQAERVQFANVTCSTMASLVADALNKRVVNEFAKYPKWYEPIVKEEDFQTLQSIKWITLAGIGSLPTVSEGNAYTELVWDDKQETAAFIKKGGYLGITVEAIDKDDTRKLRAAPAALAQGAFLTLSQAVSNIFTEINSGSAHGPDMADGYPVFDSGNHGNLGSTALSATSWAATRQLMRDQTEFAGSGGSTSALGVITAPKFLLVPNELENTALQILGATASGSANWLDNVWAEGNNYTERIRSARARVIVIDLWTDANDWVAIADPMLYPTIGVGYRYGRVPEIFSVANPTSGLMFTNDVMPVKVRFFFAVGPMDWRGLYKHVV